MHLPPPGRLNELVAQYQQFALGELQGLAHAFVLDLEGDFLDQDVVHCGLVLHQFRVEQLRLVLLLERVAEVLADLLLQLLEGHLVVRQHFFVPHEQRL